MKIKQKNDVKVDEEQIGVPFPPCEEGDIIEFDSEQNKWLVTGRKMLLSAEGDSIFIGNVDDLIFTEENKK